MRKLLFALVFGLATVVANAQTTPLKIGYADVEYILSQMPEMKQVQTDLQTLQTQLKKQYDGKVAEFQKKLQEYQAYGATVPDAVKLNSERELQDLQRNIQKLEQDSQADLQKKEQTLMQPILDKVDKSIQAVAVENSFNLILHQQYQGLTIVLYGDEKLNVSDLILKKMGVTPTPPTTTPKK
ncbi:MAG TPA: OmpH family outer membrane protein [Cyclobacteriaceae bacterium]|nr:OmpH family outer membrane protein [Cyclobacteriaceae bacterium]